MLLKVRIDYDRLSFQPPDHDHIRVSLDLNMRFIRERTSPMDWRTPSGNVILGLSFIYKFNGHPIIHSPACRGPARRGRDPFPLHHRGGQAARPFCVHPSQLHYGAV